MQTKECHKRAMKCKICELEMPFNKLQEHLNACASRTEWCWECNKYIMYRDQDEHKDICQNSGLFYHKDVKFQTSEASTNATFISPTGKQNSSLSWTGSTLLNLNENSPVFSTILSNPGGRGLLFNQSQWKGQVLLSIMLVIVKPEWFHWLVAQWPCSFMPSLYPRSEIPSVRK